MWRRRSTWLAAVILAAGGGIAWLLLSSPRSEPVYQGKALSFWLTGYTIRAEGKPEMSKADEAVRHIGTNGIPTMLKMLQAKDSRLMAKLIGLLRKQHYLKIRYIIDAEDRNFEAFYGLRALGDDASNAVPVLIQIYDKNISFVSQDQACGVLTGLGPLAKQAVPSLLRNMTNTDFYVRQNAGLALGRILSEPALVVPAMIKALHDPAPSLVGNAVVCLGDFGPQARSAVPALIELLKTSDAGLKDQVKFALTRIDPEAGAKAGVR